MRCLQRATAIVVVLTGFSATVLLLVIGMPHWCRADLDDASADDSIISEWDGFGDVSKLSLAVTAASFDHAVELNRVPFLVCCVAEPQDIVHTVLAVRSIVPRAPPVLS